MENPYSFAMPGNFFKSQPIAPVSLNLDLCLPDDAPRYLMGVGKPDEPHPVVERASITRGITPGTIGAPPDDELETQPVSQAQAESAVIPMFNDKACDVIRLTGKIMCIVKECTGGDHGEPKESASIVGLRQHLRAKHADEDHPFIVKHTLALLEDYENREPDEDLEIEIDDDEDLEEDDDV